MTSYGTQRITEEFKRGDQYVQDYEAFCPGMSFVGATVRAQVRAKSDGAVLATPAITMDATAIGTVRGTITMGGDVTATLPARCVMELEFAQPAESWGPFTPVEIWLVVERDYTR